MEMDSFMFSKEERLKTDHWAFSLKGMGQVGMLKWTDSLMVVPLTGPNKFWSPSFMRR